jgi:hypothetical protein
MNLRQAAEMALEALENMSPDTDTLVEVEPMFGSTEAVL